MLLLLPENDVLNVWILTLNNDLFLIHELQVPHVLPQLPVSLLQLPHVQAAFISKQGLQSPLLIIMVVVIRKQKLLLAVYRVERAAIVQ